MSEKERVFERVKKRFEEISNPREVEMLVDFIFALGSKSSDARDKLFRYRENCFHILEFTWLFATTQTFSAVLDDFEQKLEQIERKLET